VAVDDAVREALRRKQVREGYGKWLESWPWDHYTTLTFGIKSGPDFARRAFGRWTRRLEQEAGLPLFWFVGFEDGHLLGRLHLHALVGNTGGLSTAWMAESWTPGFSRILQYQPTRGAAFYITKYVTKELLDYDVSSNFARALTARTRQFGLALGGESRPPRK
jgi:hypothetical protein